MPQKYTKTVMHTTSPAANRFAFTQPLLFSLASVGLITMLLIRSVAGCGSQANNDPLPTDPQRLDFVVRLDDNANQNLRTKGGYTTVNDVLIAHTETDQFVAVSARCTYKEGTKLVYKAAENQFYCPLDLSRFSIDGKVVAGPATQPLTVYSTESNLSAGTVRVHN